MSVGTIGGQLYVWKELHRGHEVDREVLYAIDDDKLYLPPTPEITLRCLDCGDSLVIAV